jgi:hypothetical protein
MKLEHNSSQSPCLSHKPTECYKCSVIMIKCASFIGGNHCAFEQKHNWNLCFACNVPGVKLQIFCAPQAGTGKFINTMALGKSSWCALHHGKWSNHSAGSRWALWNILIFCKSWQTVAHSLSFVCTESLQNGHPGRWFTITWTQRFCIVIFSLTHWHTVGSLPEDYISALTTELLHWLQTCL